MSETNQSCYRLVGSSAFMLIAAVAVGLSGGTAIGETGAAARQTVTPSLSIRDGIFSSVRLMFTGNYRYSPPRPIDQSQIQRRILPPDMSVITSLPLEKAAYIPHKLDFQVAPNALTARPQAQPSIAHIVTRNTTAQKPSRQRAPDTDIRVALAHPSAPQVPTRMAIAGNTIHAIAGIEAALDELRLADERRHALLVINRDIVLATELARRFVLHPSATQPLARAGMPHLPGSRAPADESEAKTENPGAPTTVGDIPAVEIVALPKPNPRRSLIAAKAKRRKSQRRTRYTRRPQRPRPTPVAPVVFGGGEYGPKWARSFLSVN